MPIIKEKRSQKRDQISLPVIYAYSGENKITAKFGTTFDLSNSGMCFYTDTLLQDGLKLQVHISNVWDYPRSSIVRWCSMKDVSLYRVGVSFR
ncbi:MAG: PilZ domain-containing protein [Nitrospirota bacterium]